MGPEPSADYRVLVRAPVGRDGLLTSELLARAGIASLVCRSVDHLAAEMREGAGTIILTEETLEPREALASLHAALVTQPVWSDVPIVLFCSPERTTALLGSGRLPDSLAKATVVERPIAAAAMISLVQMSIRSRTRQYELRDLLVALEEARREADAASRLKDEFLATLSHELRTPLNAILGWTTMLRQGQVEPDRIARALAVVDRNVQAQARLIEDVLDMAQIITGKLRLKMEVVPVAPLVEAAIETVQPAAAAKRVRIATEIASDRGKVLADPSRLQQVFWNLLANAVKFTPPGGEIQVAISRRGDDAIVEVTDTGVGIDPEFLAFVFDRFRQANQTATRSHGGLGLGLAIVKQLVESHGGRVEAHSDGPGRGATFSVCLPLRVESGGFTADGDAAHEEPQQPIALPRISVLVVDDDPSTRELLVELMKRAGAARVRTAATAAQAFKQVVEQPPDVLIADIGLPEEDGRSLMARIRALPGAPGRVPAVALSAYTQPEDRQAAREAGFSDFVAKPALPQELLAAVSRLVAMARAGATSRPA